MLCYGAGSSIQSQFDTRRRFPILRWPYDRFIHAMTRSINATMGRWGSDATNLAHVQSFDKQLHILASHARLSIVLDQRMALHCRPPPLLPAPSPYLSSCSIHVLRPNYNRITTELQSPG